MLWFDVVMALQCSLSFLLCFAGKIMLKCAVRTCIAQPAPCYMIAMQPPWNWQATPVMEFTVKSHEWRPCNQQLLSMFCFSVAMYALNSVCSGSVHLRMQRHIIKKIWLFHFDMMITLISAYAIEKCLFLKEKIIRGPHGPMFVKKWSPLIRGIRK